MKRKTKQPRLVNMQHTPASTAAIAAINKVLNGTPPVRDTYEIMRDPPVATDMMYGIMGLDKLIDHLPVQSMRDAVRKHVAIIEEKRDEMERERDEATEELETTQEECRDMERERDNAQEELENVQANLETAEDALAEMERERDVGREELETAQAERDDAITARNFAIIERDEAHHTEFWKRADGPALVSVLSGEAPSW